MAGLRDAVVARLALGPASLHRAALAAAYPLFRLWWRVRRPPARGACVVLHDGIQVLVVRTSYRRGLLLPGGAIEPGETPRAAAERELYEETGIVVQADAMIELGTVHAREDGRLVATTLFTVSPPSLPQPTPDGREIVWAGYRSLDEIDGAMATPALEAVVPAIIRVGMIPSQWLTMKTVSAEKPNIL